MMSTIIACKFSKDKWKMLFSNDESLFCEELTIEEVKENLNIMGKEANEKAEQWSAKKRNRIAYLIY